MERIKSMLVVLFGVLLVGCLSSCSEEPRTIIYDDEDVEVNGIVYSIESLIDRTAAVESNTYPSNYSGAITILSSVTIDGQSLTVTKIGSQAFAGSSITSVTLPPTIRTIERESFRGCKNLKSFTIPTSVEKIAYEAFYKSGLEQITIPASVRDIEGKAFGSCEHLKKVTIEDSSNNLEISSYNYDDADNRCFPFTFSPIETFYCGRDVSGSSPANLLGLNEYYHNTLKHLILGESVTRLNRILDPIANLVSITCKGNTPPNGFSETSDDCFMKTIVYVPASAVGTYKSNLYWGTFRNIEPIK